MPILKEKVVKSTLVLEKTVREKIFKDLTEGNFTVIGSSMDRGDSWLSIGYEVISEVREGIELQLDSGFEIEITQITHKK